MLFPAQVKMGDILTMREGEQKMLSQDAMTMQRKDGWDGRKRKKLIAEEKQSWLYKRMYTCLCPHKHLKHFSVKQNNSQTTYLWHW